MQAVVATAFGGPEVLQVRETPDLTPGPGQLLVEVEVAGVLWIDTLIRSGQGAPRFGLQPPYTPGAGVAGVVAGVGLKVDELWIGRRVVANTGSGGYAEQVVVDVDSVLPIPAELAAADAMALLHDGNTALALFESVRIGAGQSVLIQPAAGGAGNLLVQLAHSVGALVVGGARGREKLELVRRLGADLAVDYGVDGWAEEITASIGPVDVAFDGIGGAVGGTAFTMVRPGGTFFSYGTAAGRPTRVDADEARGRDVRVVGMGQLAGFADGRMRRVARLLAEAAAGKITPTIGPTFPLERAADAHAAIAGRRAIGKVLLTVSPRARESLAAQ